MEETCETNYRFEDRSDGMDEDAGYSPLDGSDVSDDGSPVRKKTQLNSPRKVFKHESDRSLLFQNTETEVFFGGHDLGEYLHENEGEMDDSAEFWGCMKEQDAGPSQFDIGADEENGSEHTDFNGVPSFSEDTLQVKGTGRPDLDDAEDDLGMADERGVPLSSTLLDGRQYNASGRPDREEDDIFLDDKISQDSRLQDHNRVTSGIRSESLGEDTDEFLFELHAQVDENAQDDLKSAFVKISSQHECVSATLNREISRKGKESDEAKVSEGGTTRYVQLSETWPTGSSLRLKAQAPGDKGRETSLGVVNPQNLMPEKSLHGSGLTMHYQPSEAVEEVCFAPQTASEIVGDGFTKNGCVIRLGSKEAEQLLKMDVAKVGRAVFTQLQPSPKQSSLHDKSNRASIDWAAEDLGPDELSRYVEALEVKETYMDTILDMEDILFDADEGNGARVLQLGKIVPLGVGRPARDGSVSASTSSEPAAILRQPASNLTKVDWVEVIGALQRRGGASFGDRVMGVREHTIYRIKVSEGGKDWEIQRRYRDFLVLYNQLIQLFAHKGLVHLPTPWGKVKAESRKVFGNTSPGVVEIRSALIQVCLQSLLQAGPPLSNATPLLRFLFPDGAGNSHFESGQQGSGKGRELGQSGLHVLSENHVNSQQDSPKSDTLSSNTEQEQDDGGNSSVFGKTIRLIVQVHKKKSLKQQLQAQHYTCAGCYKHLELALGLVPEFAQNWGWTGPRFCEYSGQLFCSTCHLNETAVIPSWVLEHWDFTPRPVSQLAKAYLDSIYDKPMLCVSAVNPYLYARVPVLAHLSEIRRNLSRMLVCIRCPARARIQAMIGSRRYLLENNDFFALRDLADLSKGAFAVLPGFLQAMLVKISVHITRECSVCSKLGEACAAMELCDDPCDLIYPYQDKTITKCPSCHLSYHKRCFLRCKRCSCKRDQSFQILEDLPYNGEILRSHLDTEPDLRRSASSSTSGGEDVAAGSTVAVGESMVKAKKSLLANLLGSKDIQSSTLGGEDLGAGSTITVGESLVKAKKSLLANLLGSKETQPSELQRERKNSAVLDMSAHLSPLEL